MARDVSTPRGKRRWIGPLLIGFAILAVTMFTLSAFFLSSWTETRSVNADDAERVFDAARERYGATQPYLAIDAEGSVRITRELPTAEPSELEALHVLSFIPAREQLIDVGFPYWFVRMKMSDTVNLGTVTSLIAGDWQNLDLRLTEDDLEALGPTLLLDHKLESGARIMLWTE
jgi:hypothetical protein